MGSKQFADALRVQHLLHHDEQHLQYLQYIASLRLEHVAMLSGAICAIDHSHKVCWHFDILCPYLTEGIPDHEAHCTRGGRAGVYWSVDRHK